MFNKYLPKACLLLLLITILSFCSSCATLSNTPDKQAVYQEIKAEFEALDPFFCRNELSKFGGGHTYVTCRYREERNVNWGTLVIYTPIRASANLYINGYRYRRTLTDPREIFYLLKYMESFVQFEAITTDVTEVSGW